MIKHVQLRGSSIVQMLAMVAVILLVLPLSVMAAGTDPDADGDGSTASPYIIDEASDLTWLSTKVAAGTTYSGFNFLQVANVDMSGVSGWAPIGSSTKNFAGNYNGNGYTISGLSCTSTLYNVGLFGYVSGGTLKNITLSDFTIVNASDTSGSPVTGALVGWTSGTVSNCHVTGTSSVTCNVAASSSIGGLIGQSGGAVSACSSNATISSTNNYVVMGGVLGNASGAVTNCLFTGSISYSSASSAVNGIGGIVGGKLNTTIQKCLSIGTITVSPSGAKIGGICGNVYDSASDAYVAASDANYFLSGTASNGYGAYYSPSNTGSAVSNTGATAQVAATLKASTDAIYSSWDFVAIWRNQTDGTTYPSLRKVGTVSTTSVDASDPEAVVVSANVTADGGSTVTARGVEYASSGGSSFTQVASGSGTGAYTATLSSLPMGVYIIRAYATNVVGTVYGASLQYTKAPSGSGTAADPYLIGSAAELNFVRYAPTAYYQLICDLDLSGTSYESWVPMCTDASPFTGTFDGDGHVISGFTAGTYASTETASTGSGLFACIGTSGVVKKLGVNGSYIDAYATGGIASINKGTIEQCYNLGAISSTVDWGSVGGMAGYNAGGTINNCYNTGDMTVTSSTEPYAAGIAGAAYDGAISKCYNTGTINGGSAGYGAGIMAYCWSSAVTVDGCFNAGVISGNFKGGITGDRTVTNCDYLAQSGLTTIDGSTAWTGQASSDYFTAGSGGAYSAAFYTTASWDFTTVWRYVSGKNPELRAFPIVQSAVLSPSSALTEANLDTTSVTVTLSGTTFADSTLSAANFALNNAPSGVSVESVTYDSTTTCIVNLAYDGADFDADVTTFSLTIAAAELASASELTSGALTITATVEPVTAANSTVSASLSSVEADGTTTSTITVTLKDTKGSVMSGKTVTLAQGAGSSTITTVTGTTNSSGQATFTVKSTKAETVSYTATDTTDSIAVTQTASVTFTAGVPTAASSTVSSSLSSLESDGATTATITVTLKDANGNAVSGKTVTLAQGTGSSTITTVTGTTNSSGQAAFTVKSTKAEAVTYTATDTSDGVVVTQTASVTFTAGTPSAANSSVAASESTVIGNGSSTATITVTLKDANGNLVSGKTVTLAQGTGSSTITTVTGTTNSSGQATFTVKSSRAETVTYTATDTTDSVVVTQTASVTFTLVNDAPSFTKGADQTVLEDAGAQSVSGWATSISAGPSDESSQTVSFTLSNDNNALFSVQPAVAADGTLTYTPAADASGTATVTISATDNGGTANGGDDTSDSQTFTITVTAVNDVPSFTMGADQTLPEDAGAQTVGGWATSISAGATNESAQTVSFTVSNNNNALFSAQPAVASDGALTYTPAANASGTATVTIYLSDDGGTANGGDDTSDSQTFTITVVPPNPVVTDVDASTADGAYKAGAVLSLLVTFDQAVTVVTSGDAPTLLLETGSTDRTATYVSGSASTTLVFQYTVQSGDTTADLDYSSTTAFTLNGATIRNASDLDASLTLPTPGAAGSLGANKALVIDTTAPAAPAIAAASATTVTGHAEPGSTVTATVDGGATPAGTAVADATTGLWTCTLTSSLTAGSAHSFTATATDAAGNVSALSSAFALTVGSGATWIVTVNTDDTTTPTAGMLRYAVNNAASGDTILFALTSGNETITIGAELAISGKSLTIDGSNTASDGTATGSGTAVTVQVTTPGMSTWRVFTLAPASGQTVAISALTLRGGVPNSGGVVYISTAGAVSLTGVTLKDGKANLYGGGLYVTAGSVTLTNTTINGNTADEGGGLCVAGGTATLTNSTLSGNSSYSGGGVYVFAGRTVTLVNSIVIANTATTAGNDLFNASGTLNIYGSWYADLAGTVTTTATAPNVTTAYTSGDLGSLADNGGATPTLALNANAPAVGAGVLCYYNATDGYYFLGSDGSYYKVTAPTTAFTPTDPAADLISTDQRGVTRAAPLSMGAFQLVGVASATVPTDGVYTTGDALSFTVNFSDAVTVDTTSGTPQLALTIGSSTVHASYASGSGSAALIFSYTVQSGDTDVDGIAVTSSAVDLNGGTIADSIGYAAALTLPTLTTTGILVDTTAPETTLLTYPATLTNSATASFTFGGDDGSGSGVASFEASLDSGAYATATSSLTLTGLSDGSHTFAVRAIDAAGNVDASPASYTWMVDTSAPTTPTVQTTTPTAISGTAEAGSTVSIYDGATLLGSATVGADGTWTIPVGTLAGGGHTLRLTVTDAAGNATTLEFAFSSSYSGDSDGDWKLGLPELLRMMELYNAVENGQRTGAYHTDATTADGFAPGAGTRSRYHSADTNRDGLIGLTELLRAIELYNTMDGTTRTGAYHIDPTTEDGYAPGAN